MAEKQSENVVASEAPKRLHIATYAADRKKGGYNIRVVGPHAAEFVGREVPVTRRDLTESMEKLTKLLWSGVDEGTKENPGSGKPAALYAFAPKPRVDDEIVF